MTSPREVRAARLEIGLSEAEAAQIVGVSEETWRAWETDPQLDSYEQISATAWETFITQTEDLRPENSGFTFRRRGVPPIDSY